MKVNAIVLSAGKGTRMRSDLPKVVHRVCGYEMVNMVLKNLTEAGVDKSYVVVGYKADEVVKRVDSRFNVEFAMQTEQLGTGHAVKCAGGQLRDEEGITIITCGDTPLISPKTYEKLIKKHIGSKEDLTILTAKIENSTGYGRIIRNDVEQVKAIVEEKDADEQQKMIKEINTGIFCFDNKKLFKYIEEIKNNNNQAEYYLTDLVDIFNQNAEKVSAYTTPYPEETIGVNDLVALSEASNILKARINKEHLINGVGIVDPNNTYISPNVIIGAGTNIYPGCYITGDTVIGTGNMIFPNSVLDDVTIGDNNQIGPMAYLRNNASIEDNCRIGNFVEVKNSNIASGSKSAHLTYIGDADVGNNVNFGCGTITANYDGVNKNRTVIGNNVFIGSNTNLIAPLTIEDDVFIAAGTTVTNNVNKNKFVIGRTKADIKEKR